MNDTMRSASETARVLDVEFLELVRAYAATGAGWGEELFDSRARATFAYQFETNAPYRRFAQSLGLEHPHDVRSWREIPAVPASAFKDATLATFDVAHAELIFHTSGTSAERSGKHYVERAALYDAALLAGFDRHMLGDGARLRYLNLVPNPRFRRHSSLAYMMGHVGVLRGDGKAAYFLGERDAAESAGRPYEAAGSNGAGMEPALDVAAFERALDASIAAKQPACVAGTAFAFVALVDALGAKRRTFVAPSGSRVMETGGFKGRSRVVARDELYASLEATLGIAQSSIVAEYGMTELLTQYYDAPHSRQATTRPKVSPPWLRTLVVDAAGHIVPDGETGTLRHIDLANRSSVVAIDTEDRGYRVSEGLVLLGRAEEAPPRGCSLTAEDLVAVRDRVGPKR